MIRLLEKLILNSKNKNIYFCLESIVVSDVCCLYFYCRMSEWWRGSTGGVIWVECGWEGALKWLEPALFESIVQTS